MTRDKNPQEESEVHVAIVAAVGIATNTETPKGEELLPPDLAAKYRAAKAKLRRKPSGK